METQGIEALVAIGGDDTLSVAARLAEHGANVVGLPKTVDFDLAVTEYCIGFDSAVAIVTESLDRLHTTAASHHRVMVCEVMGRDTGWLAVMGGIAGGAGRPLVFLAAERVSKLLGTTGNVVLTRMLGVVLAALAVQFVIDGASAVVHAGM